MFRTRGVIVLQWIINMHLVVEVCECVVAIAAEVWPSIIEVGCWKYMIVKSVLVIIS